MGLYDYGFRDYKPVLGRWTTVDPIRDSHNWYAYVGNDPINYIDPWGLCPADDKKAAVDDKDTKFKPFEQIKEGIGRVLKDYEESSLYFEKLERELILEQNRSIIGEEAYEELKEQLEKEYYEAHKEIDKFYLDVFGVPEKPTLEIDSNKMPHIAENISSAQKSGKPIVLTYTSNKRRQRRNRREATGGMDAGPGMSIDEYPFASTYEGGAGAQTRAVPEEEQRIQGGTLSSFYRQLKDGDKFYAIVK